MYLLLRPSQARPAARLCPGVPHRFHQVRPPVGLAEAGAPAIDSASPRRCVGRTPLWGRRRRAGRVDRLLLAPRNTGDVRPAVAPEGANLVSPAIHVLGGADRLRRGPRGPVPVPRAHEASHDTTPRRRAMNLFVADPHWGVWIVLYFFLGGLAAGAYFLAVLFEWFGTADDARVARVAHWLAFPLTFLCLVFLVVDLDRPERFWHMLLKSEVVKQAIAEGFPFSGSGWQWASDAPLLRTNSPMSAGSWGLSVFAFCAFVSFLTVARPYWRLSRWLDRPWIRQPVRAVGLLAAFYVGSYTGSLLSATNQPVWSHTTWLSALFFASSISTGLATMILLARWKRVGTDAARHKLESADLWAAGLELVVFVAFLISLRAVLEPVLGTVAGLILVLGTFVLGLAAPLVVHKVYGPRGWSQSATAVLVLAGGLCLRVGAVTVNAELLARADSIRPETVPTQPTDNGPAAPDPGNRGPQIVPRTKLPGDE